jgi:hypothetical protein
MKIVPGMKLVLLAFVVAIAAGCAASQQMSAEDRAKVKSAKVGSVEKQQLFLLAPSGANIGMMFGAIGGAVTGAVAEDNTKVFAAFVEKNGISVEKIVREEVEAALRASGKLALVGADDAAAPTLKISVPQYGFGVPHLLSSNVVPTMWVKCDLVDASGRLLWSANDRMLPSIANKVEPTTWEQMRDNPKKIEEEWRKAAQILAKNIVADL